MKALIYVLALLGLISIRFNEAYSQKPSIKPVITYDVFYKEFKGIEIDYSKTYKVTDFFIPRDGITFNLETGTIYMCKPVCGKICAAVFKGSGTVSITPPIKVEQDQMERFLKKRFLEEKITEAVFFFSDGTDNDISQNNLPFPSPNDKKLDNLVETAVSCMADKKTEEVAEHITKALLENRRSDMFTAFIKPVTGDNLVVILNPYSTEEVSVYRCKSFLSLMSDMELINMYHSPGELEANPGQTDFPNHDDIRINKYVIDIILKNSLHMYCRTSVEATGLLDSAQWLAFQLSDKLEVDSVISGNGERLLFHKKPESSTLWVRMPEQTAKGQIYTLTFYYNGSMISRQFDITYFKTSASMWYPRYGDREKADFDIFYHIPDNYRFASVGENVHTDTTDGVINTRWVSTFPIRNASFNLGPYRKDEISDSTLPKIQVMSVSEDLRENVLHDVAQSFKFYQNLYGPLPVKSFNITEIPFSYGEAFPGLLHLSTFAFEYKEDDGETEMFCSHECAHQWWGIGVDFKSYRDQWISEGFATYSSMLYYQLIVKDNNRFFQVLNDYKKELINLRKTILGDGVEGGPISLGWRNSSTDATSGDYSLIIYKKGAWVLHMLRNMNLNLKTMNEDVFKRILKTFFNKYLGKHASTADFRAICEKEMGVDLGWFFEQWVDGTKVPKYRYAFKTEKMPDGNKYVTKLKIEQQNVPAEFKMFIPIKIEFDGANPIRERIFMTGGKAEMELPPYAYIPENVVLNDLESVLCEVEQVDWEDIN